MRPFLICCLTFICIAAVGQRMKVNFQAGLLASFAVGEDADFEPMQSPNIDLNPWLSFKVLPKISSNTNLDVLFEVGDRLNIGTGLHYVPKGYWVYIYDRGELSARELTTINQFEIPFILDFEFGKKWSFQFSPFMSMLVISKVRLRDVDGDDHEQYRLGEFDTERPRDLNAGFQVAIQKVFKSGLFVQGAVQYQNSYFSNQDIRSVTPTLGVGYQFLPRPKAI